MCPVKKASHCAAVIGTRTNGFDATASARAAAPSAPIKWLPRSSLVSVVLTPSGTASEAAPAASRRRSAGQLRVHLERRRQFRGARACETAAAQVATRERGADLERLCEMHGALVSKASKAKPTARLFFVFVALLLFWPNLRDARAADPVGREVERGERPVDHFFGSTSPGSFSRPFCRPSPCRTATLSGAAAAPR
jgi:hypothetical protein